MLRKAILHLKRSDRVMKRVIERVGRYGLEPKAEGTHFDHIVRAIIYQQLSGKAAATIHERVRAIYGGTNPTPEQLLSTSEERLRAAGLSKQKLGYLKDLASHSMTGSVDFARLHENEDEQIIEQLLKVKGVGRWTAQMFLMFRLGRLNVLPTVDLGINKAIMREYKLKKMPSPKDVLKIGAKWAPFATVACWYLWRTLDPPQAPKKVASEKKTRRNGAKGKLK